MRLIIIDTMVLLHIIDSHARTFGQDSEIVQEFAEASLLWINSLDFCPQWAAEREHNKVLWVRDTKPYWRNEFDFDYKAQRKPMPLSMSWVYRGFKKLSQDGTLTTLGLPGQEADDIAAAIIRMRHQLDFDQYILFTVDSDWQGLVADTSICWVDVKGFEPRVRTKREIYQWQSNKHKKQSAHEKALWPMPEYELWTSESIWDWKCAVGDKADNLSPDSSPYLINLFNPPRVFDPLNEADQIRQKLSEVRSQGKPDGKALYNQLNCFGIGVPLQELYFPSAMLAPVKLAA